MYLLNCIAQQLQFCDSISCQAPAAEHVAPVAPLFTPDGHTDSAAHVIG